MNALSYSGFELNSEKPISLLWTKQIQGNQDLKLLNPLSKVNHFPGSQYIGRKDLMHEVINATKYKTKLTP